MENTQKKEIIEQYISAYNSFDVLAMVKDLDDDIVFENISNDVVGLRTEGIDAFRQQAEAAKQYFTQRTQRIESWQFKDSVVTINIDYHAILFIDLPNGLKKGDPLEMKGHSEFEFRNEKIVKIVDRI